MRRSRLALHLLVVLPMVLGCHKRVSSRSPTVVFIAKRVVTNDPAQPLATALAWKHGALLAVGSEAEVLKAAGDEALIERFPDATIVPGLIDAHVHLAGLGLALTTLSVSGAQSEVDAAKAVASVPHGSWQGEWIIGRGWDQTRWPGQQFPTRASLDAYQRTTPVFLSRIDGHAGWANSAGLRRAKITKDTKDPPGGRIVRDANGEPTGVLIDNAMALVEAVMGPPTAEQLQGRLKVALERCAQLGLTQVHDAGTDLQTFAQLQAWDALGVLPVRVYAMAAGQGADAERFREQGPFGGRFLELRAVKLVLDGALGSRGAALEHPYSDEPTQRGLLVLDPTEFAARAKAMSEAGFQVAVHAIGDRANRIALDTLGALDATRRHRIEHAQLLAPHDVPRFATLNIIASVQPTHATSDLRWAEDRVGPERVKLAYAWRSLLDAGARLAFGSDFPIEDPNPLLGLFAARTRTDAQGEPRGGWQPQQVLSATEALAGFTTGAAYASFAEDRRGMLKPGYDADFTMLTIDPLTATPAEVRSGGVRLTVVGGIDVYRAP